MKNVLFVYVKLINGDLQLKLKNSTYIFFFFFLAFDFLATFDLI